MFLLLQLDDITFLKTILKKYPEIQYTVLENQTTAEAEQNNMFSDSLASKVFEKNNLPDTVEFDRAAVGLLCLKYVLSNDYESFTACQNPSVKLSFESFQKLRQFTKNVIKTPEDLEIAVYTIMCNDLGKTHTLINAYQALKKNTDADHDTIFATLLNEKPELFSGFQNLSYNQKAIILEGLNTTFNLGQFVQGENTPADLPKIQSIGRKARDLYILHAFYDVTGAAGHVKNNGSLVMSEPVYYGYDLAIKSLMTKPFTDSYNRYMSIRGDLVGFDVKTPKGFALSRLAALSRCFKKSDGKLLSEVYDCLPKNVQNILKKELNETGLNNTSAVLIYYAPAFIDNTKKNYLNRLSPDANNIEKRKALYNAYTSAFTTLAQIYIATRIAIKKKNLTGVITVDIHNLAKQALQNTDAFHKNLIDVNINTEKSFGTANLKEATQINIKPFVRNQSISDILPKGKTAFIGIGGGSDCVQAGQLAFFNPKQTGCIISVRTDKTQSQGKKTKQVGIKREIFNHGGEIVPDVYKVLPDTTGHGRFLENLVVCTEIPVYIVLDKQDGMLGQKIHSAIQNCGGVDNIVSVDTGGDSLFLSQTENLNSSKSTPDQDYASLKAIYELEGYKNKTSVILAIGVDTPSYAHSVLSKASADFILFSEQEKNQIIKNYHQWGMDGSSDSAFGKTPLALQEALKETKGLCVLPLPSHVVLDDKNTWDPFIIITDAMKYVAVMSLEKHFQVITHHTENSLLQNYVSYKNNKTR